MDTATEIVARPEKTRQGLKPGQRRGIDVEGRLVARPEKTRQGLKQNTPGGRTFSFHPLQGLKKPDRD